jgi:hypothetical protein
MFHGVLYHRYKALKVKSKTTILPDDTVNIDKYPLVKRIEMFRAYRNHGNIVYRLTTLIIPGQQISWDPVCRGVLDGLDQARRHAGRPWEQEIPYSIRAQ